MATTGTGHLSLTGPVKGTLKFGGR